MFFEAYKKLLTAILVLLVILSLGSIGYSIIEKDMDLFSAFYMSVITVTTVGFSEVDGITAASRPLTIALIFMGFGLISYVLLATAQLVVNGELMRLFGRHKLDKRLNSLKDHVIICGFGRIGAVLAQFMVEYGQPYVIVEKDEALINEFEDGNHLYVIGDATQDATLEKAGISRASKLVAATNLDSQNVFIVLTARELNPELVIHSRAYAEEAEKRLLRAGADEVVFPDTIGGYRMAMGMMRPTFTNFLEVVSRPYSEGHIAVDELALSKNCHLIGKALKDTSIRQEFNLIILAIIGEDGNYRFNPDKDTVIEEDDTLIAIGLRSDLTAFSKRMNI